MKLRGSDGYTGDVIAQFERIIAQDIVFHSGRYFRFPFPSFEARVFQHEITWLQSQFPTVNWMEKHNFSWATGIYEK